MTSATSDTGSGVGQHYWTVDLPVPAKASTALQQFIAMAQDALQTAVDLLGRGAPELPPVMDDLLQPVTYTDLGSGAANSDYQNLLSEIESRQTSLLSTDQQVLQASVTVSASSDTTLQYIETIVTELESELSSVTGTLTAAENSALMQQIGEVVDMVNARVTSAYETNQGIAGESSDSGDTSDAASGATDASYDTGTGTTSSTGSDSSDGLSSILSMLPMLAMPLMSVAPELLKDFTKATQPNGASGAAQSATGRTGSHGSPQPTPAVANSVPSVANSVPAVANTAASGQQTNQPAQSATAQPTTTQPAANTTPTQANVVPAVANGSVSGKQRNQSQPGQSQADQPATQEQPAPQE